MHDNILTIDPINPNLSVQGGRQSSRGVELTLSAVPLPRLRLDSSLFFVDAQFDVLLEAGGADRSGNRPPNGPRRGVTLAASYDLAQAPVTLGITVRNAGDVYFNTANTVSAQGYTVADAAAVYRMGRSSVAVRVRNLTDAFYADWDEWPTPRRSFAPRAVRRDAEHAVLVAGSAMSHLWIKTPDSSTLTCPSCGHQANEAMPMDRCLFFYRCLGCGALIRPKPGDCCVFCSYGDRRCPSVLDGAHIPDEAPAT